MLRIRLKRVGLKKQPSYRIVVTDKRKARDGKPTEVIGFYNPRTRPETVEYKEDRMLHWLSVGAQPSEAVARMLKNNGTMDRFARLNEGEELEKLLAEVEEAKANAEPISPKTQYGAPLKAKSKDKPVAELVEEVKEEPEAEEVIEEESEESEETEA